MKPSNCSQPVTAWPTAAYTMAADTENKPELKC